MDDSDQELIDKGHGVRHYSCGHESRCRCKHGSNLQVNVDEPCWDCLNNSDFIQSLTNEEIHNLARKGLIKGFFTLDRIPAPSKPYNGILAGKGLNAKQIKSYVVTGELPIDEKAPPGWKGTVKAMKKHKEVDNPFALAWSMKKRGAEPHYKDSDTSPPEKKKRFQEWLKERDA